MKDDIVYFSTNQKTCSWIMGDHHCWIQTYEKKISHRIQEWSFAIKVAEGFNCEIWIYSIPRRKWRWALKKLGIVLPVKNRSRYLTGLKTGQPNLKKRG